MNIKLEYTIDFGNTQERIDLFNWISKQDNPNEFILDTLERAMQEKNKNKMIITEDELKEIIDSIDDDFWK